MPNVFIENIQPAHDRISIIGPAHHHLIHVLRLQVNDHLNVLDNAGHIYETKISTLSKNSADCQIIRTAAVSALAYKLVLAQALIKGEKMDWLVQKATELGVSEILPLITERTQVKLSVADAVHKQVRWQSIAQAAAEQCERSDLPVISKPVALKGYQPGKSANELSLLCAARSQAEKLQSNTLPGSPGKITIFVGPEGGFSAEEENTLIDNGCRPISLGSNILRAETAAIACLSQLNLFL
ncbi:MAG: 16S rRNA (uracil(1498)-N(3))-methyltransferase [Candidatus Margulisiibacteriota bacterium]|jgi:16S rRNA (uracil1498-N3)-methyltransferase